MGGWVGGWVVEYKAVRTRYLGSRLGGEEKKQSVRIPPTHPPTHPNRDPREYLIVGTCMALEDEEEPREG